VAAAEVVVVVVVAAAAGGGGVGGAAAGGGSGGGGDGMKQYLHPVQPNARQKFSSNTRSCQMPPDCTYCWQIRGLTASKTQKETKNLCFNV
jgi:hypothetical protein